MQNATVILFLLGPIVVFALHRIALAKVWRKQAVRRPRRTIDRIGAMLMAGPVLYWFFNAQTDVSAMFCVLVYLLGTTILALRAHFAFVCPAWGNRDTYNAVLRSLSKEEAEKENERWCRESDQFWQAHLRMLDEEKRKMYGRPPRTSENRK